MTIFSSLFGGRLDRELGSDDSTVLFTTARRKAAINEAMGQFADITECLERTVQINMVGGSSGVGPLSLPHGEYDLNSTTIIPDGDFVRLSKKQPQFVYTDASSQTTILSGDDFPRREVEWLNRFRPGWQESTTASTTQQMPESFYERVDGGARYFGLQPVPSTGPGASAYVSVSYIFAPDPLTSDSQEPFTVDGESRRDLRPFHQGLVHYAAAQLEKLRRDTEASDRQMQQFYGYVTRWLGSLRVKSGRQVSFARQYFRPSRLADRGSDPRR